MLRSELATYAAELLTGQGAEVDLNPTDDNIKRCSFLLAKGSHGLPSAARGNPTIKHYGNVRLRGGRCRRGGRRVVALAGWSEGGRRVVGTCRGLCSAYLCVFAHIALRI